MIRFGDNSMSSATGHNHGMELPNEGIKRAIELERAHKEYGVTGDENFLKRSDSVPDGPTIVHTLGNSNKWEYGVSPMTTLRLLIMLIMLIMLIIKKVDAIINPKGERLEKVRNLKSEDLEKRVGVVVKLLIYKFPNYLHL